MGGFADVNCISYVFNEGRMHVAGYDAGPSESIIIDENGDIVHGTESQHAAHESSLSLCKDKSFASHYPDRRGTKIHWIWSSHSDFLE